MPTVRLTETSIPGVYQGADGRVFSRVDGVETQCALCQRWCHTAFRWADQHVCRRHVRVARRDRIRLTTTFACRVYRQTVTQRPPATVLRRDDIIAVVGRPERVGKYDKLVLPGRDGFVLVPRSRWAWV